VWSGVTWSTNRRRETTQPEPGGGAMLDGPGMCGRAREHEELRGSVKHLHAHCTHPLKREFTRIYDLAFFFLLAQYAKYAQQYAKYVCIICKFLCNQICNEYAEYSA
jgi:hypothetical protein